MTDTQELEAIDKLIDVVEAGGLTERHFSKLFCDAAPEIYLWRRVVYAAHDGSIDAARTLHNALLPGWAWAIGTCNVSDDARVFPQDDSRAPDGGEWSQYTDIDQRPPGNPARAWLASILIAYRAQVAA